LNIAIIPDTPIIK